MSTTWALLDPQAPAWPAAVDTLWAGLNPRGGLVVPDYFVKTTFVLMGGRLAVGYDAAGAATSVGLLFPRGRDDGRHAYTLRLHGPAADVDALAALLAPATFVLHDPTGPHTYTPTHIRAGGFELGAPAHDELPAIRALHCAIWGGSDAARYPDDLHSAEFAPGTSLVARHEGRVVGFLLGFYRFGLPALAALGLSLSLDLAVESQVMGVAPEARRFGLAAMLKQAQAREALARGLDLIHWTVDPLQYPNAVLNFGRLRAVAGEFYPAYYPFQNELNRVPASRLGLAWLPRSAWGRVGLEERAHNQGRDLGGFPGVAMLNDGPHPLEEPGDVPYLALEIPADWTALQREDLGLAGSWRATTDALLGRHIGFAPGRYLVTDVVRQGDRRYLVARRFEPDLLS